MVPFRPLFLAIVLCAPVFASAALQQNLVGQHVEAQSVAFATVGPGGTVRYDIWEDTWDLVPVSGTITLHLPAGLTYARKDGVDHCQWTLPSGSGGDVVCTASLTGSNWMAYSIYATVAPSAAPGDILNAQLIWNFDGQVTQTHTTKVVPATDLRVTAVSSATARAGVQYPVTVRLTNAGTATAYAPEFVVKPTPFGTNTTFYPASYNSGCATYGANFECTAADLAPGASVDVLMYAASDSAATSESLHIIGSITNESLATTADNSFDLVTPLDTTIVPSMALSVSPSSAQTGADYKLSGTLSTDGPAARNLTLTYDTPPNTVFRGATATGLTCTGPAVDSPGRVVCSTPLLTRLTQKPSSPSATYSITVRTNVPGQVTHTVTSNASNMTAPVAATATGSVVTADVRLSATLTASAKRVLTGDDVTFSLVVKNAGTDASTTIETTLDIPASLQVLGIIAPVSGSDGCTSSRPYLCVVASLAGAHDVTYTIRTRATTPGDATVSATVSRGAETVAQPSASVTVAAPVAALVATLTGDRSVVPVSDQLVYTLKVSNTGPDPASAITADVELKGDNGVVSVTADGFVSCTVQRPLVRCQLPTLAASGSAAMTVTLKSPSSPGTMSATANVTAVVGSAQTASISTPVIARGDADLAVETPQLARGAALLQPVTLSFTVRNSGSSDAPAAAFDATLSSGLTLTSLSTTRGTCTATRCSLGTLTSGSSAEITIMLLPTQAGSGFVRGAASTTAKQVTTDNDAQQVAVQVAAPRSRAARH